MSTVVSSQDQDGPNDVSWPLVHLGDYLEFITSGSRGWAQYYSDVGPTFIRVGNFNRGGIALDLTEVQKVQPLASAERNRTRILPGDVLITITADLGMTAVVPMSLGEAYINQHVALLRPKAAFNPHFLAWYIGCTRQAEDQLFEKNRGAVKAGLGLDDLRGLQVPLPPMETQQSVVSQLEARLSRLDKAASDLRKVDAKLARHRAAVLAAATAGMLVPTEAELARRESRTYEPASVLLDRILVERRARWEAEQIATFRAKGLKPRDDKWKAKYQPPVAPDTTDLPELPEGWAWASTDQLAADEPRSITDGPFGSNLKSEHYTESGPRVIRLQNIGDGNFVDERAHIRPDHFASLANHHVHPGDIVLAALGEVLPRACLIPADLGPALVKADCMRVKPDPALVITRYLLAALISPQVQHRTASVVKGVGRPRINLGTVRGLPLPLPPLAEQARIVLALDQGQTLYTQTLRAATASRRRVAGLRSAILQAAFQPPEAARAS
jgi:type I restriction enzyme S subunit